MATSLEISGRNLLPVKEAAQASSYSRGYITRLAREGKILASNVGSQWFVDFDSLRNYESVSFIESEIRHKQLSAERKREHQLRDSSERKSERLSGKVRKLQVKSAVIGGFALAVGLFGGTIGYNLLGKYSDVSNFYSQPKMESVVNVANTAGTVSPAQDLSKKVVVNNSSITGSDSIVSEPTQKISKMKEDDVYGVLLLPFVDTTSTSSLDSIFSDPVQVQRHQDGAYSVLWIDSEGKKQNKRVPFVVLPVEEGFEVSEDSSLNTTNI